MRQRVGLDTFGNRTKNSGRSARVLRADWHNARLREEMPMAGTLRDKAYTMKWIFWTRVRIRHLGPLPGRAVRNPLAAFGSPSRIGSPDAPPSRRRVWCGQSPTPRRICFTPMAHSSSYVDTMLRVLSRSSINGSARSLSTASYTACCPGGRWPRRNPRLSQAECARSPVGEPTDTISIVASGVPQIH